MIDYSKFSKDELIDIIKVFIRVCQRFIDSFANCEEELRFLDGIKIDCPEKNAFNILKNAGIENLKDLTKLSNEILIKGRQ